MDFPDVKVSEISFQEQLSSREFCVIFLVTIRGRTCVMKVHHGCGPKQPYESRHREKNIYLCESTAYRRLAQAGVCARGITPQFYGATENIDPTLCQPHLKAFLRDEYRPTAILLEYILNMEELNWKNYTEKRMQNFIDGINEIHNALVEHSDIHPRNMMVVNGVPERAIWIDFDRAQTFSDELRERQKGWIRFEKLLVKEMADFMKHDFTEGRMDKTSQYYR